MDLRVDPSRPVSGLRTRYQPRSRIGQGLLTVAPWVDVILLFLCFVLLDSKVVLRPGVIIDLPETQVVTGSRSSLMAVVMSVASTGGRAGGEIVFFDDERFLAGSEPQMQRLRDVFASRAIEHPDEDLIIQADKNAEHGTVMRIINMAMEVGIRRVNVAARPF